MDHSSEAKKHPARRLRPFLWGAGALLLSAAAYLLIAPLTETHPSLTVEGSADWMSRLPDERLLSELFIPGTHDSGADFAQLAYFSKCQSSGIRTQLEEGFRYLDIRLGVLESDDPQELRFFHGICACRTGVWPWSAPLTLEAALSDCYAFLDAHPSETVLFCVKFQQGDDTVELQRLLAKAIEKAPRYWLLTDRLPTLGEARGKLVLLRRYPDAADLEEKAGLYLYWRDQGSRLDTTLSDAFSHLSFGLLQVQDRYQYDTEEKWTAFTAGLASDDDADLRLHFLSTNGSPAFGHPYGYARKLNRRLLEWMPGDITPAWIIVDFSDASLAEKIYRLNDPG
ncbi:MAG: hypothetical protein ILP12_05850 [Lachnospiraceae bacterium]|nr:hypothetical protein [Lachnospiraceae bacterium]